MSNTKARDYLLTINNPLDHNLDRDKLITICQKLTPAYFCMSDEIGIEEKTPHTHVYISFTNARHFNTVRKAFDNVAHVDECKGSPDENRDYVFKEGKWEADEKADTNLRETHYEEGELPERHQGQRNDLTAISDDVKNGLDVYEIIEKYPNQAFNIDRLSRLVNLQKERQFRLVFREIHVTYLSGSTGSGKTRYVMEKYGYQNVYRVTDYQHPFDSYNFEKVILFEEFRGDLPIKDMLKYLEGYPLQLPCRYSNKTACYTQVYLCSNISLDEQFCDVQRCEEETYLAFIRRIGTVMEFDGPHKYVFTSVDDYNARLFLTLDEYEALERTHSPEESSRGN